jgi:hypothetical protein
MATRLNNEKRDILCSLARRVIDDTPVDPAIQARLDASVVDVIAKYKTMYDLIQKKIAARCPPEELAVLKKWRRANISTFVYLANLDDRNRYERFSAIDDDINSPTRIHELCGRVTKVIDGMERRVKREDNEYPFITPDDRPIGLSDEEYKLYTAYREARLEHTAAEEAVARQKETLRRALATLISTSRTFEKVVEVWPEAKTVAADICTTGTELSVLSNEAIDVIKASMAARGVTETNEPSK